MLKRRVAADEDRYITHSHKRLNSCTFTPNKLCPPAGCQRAVSTPARHQSRNQEIAKELSLGAKEPSLGAKDLSLGAKELSLRFSRYLQPWILQLSVIEHDID